jgi:hypothetical protein
MNTKLRIQALLLAAAMGATSASASVRVYGEASSTGPEIKVEVYADIADTAIVSHTFKLFYNAGQLHLLNADVNSGVWYLRNSNTSYPYPEPDGSIPGEILFLGAHMDGSNPRAGVSGNRVLLGTARFSRNSPATPTFDMTIGRAGQFANFVNTDAATLEVLPGQVVLLAVKPNPADQDLDGLSDSWEEQFFGSTRGVFYSDDTDGDGANNLGEQAAGSDPTDARSVLRLEITEGRERVHLEWPSVDDRFYTIEGSKQLGRFEPLKEGIKATPPLNTFDFDRIDLPETLFFRIRVEPPPLR